MHDLQRFMSQFRFNPGMAGFIGVERECFVADMQRRIVPMATEVLARLTESRHAAQFSHELSACQIEMKTRPSKPEIVDDELEALDETLERALRECDLMALHDEVGPADMPLDVSPLDRYIAITSDMPRDQLLAACRIIATHVHVGMPDAATALRVYNRVLKHTTKLIAEGDGSNGERLRIYQTVAPTCKPRPYTDWRAFHADATDQGFADDPRRNWQLVRISPWGTIEFRMFGTTPNPVKAGRWARMCHYRCMEAL